MKFKIGDKVSTNPEYDESLICHDWWKSNKNEIMTIKNMDIEKKDYRVRENGYIWRDEWLLPVYGDFIEENEMMI